MTKAVNPKNQALWQLPDLYSFLCEWAYEVYDQEKHPALGQSPREAWESGLDLGGPREHRRIRYDDVFRVLTLPGSPRETALVYRNHQKRAKKPRAFKPGRNGPQLAWKMFIKFSLLTE